MPERRKAVNKEYSAKMRALRSYVDFNYDLRKPLASAQKAQINRYYEALYALQARHNVIYRTKNKKRLKEVQRLGRNEFDNLPRFKVALIESPPSNPTRVRFTKKGKPRLVSKFFNMGFLDFDMRRLVKDPDSEIARVLAQSRARFFQIATGKFHSRGIFSRSRVSPRVREWMYKYSPSAENPNVLNSGGDLNHRFERWMHGLIEIDLRNQDEVMQFLRKENELKKKKRPRRRGLKQRKCKAGHYAPTSDFSSPQSLYCRRHEKNKRSR